MLALDTSRPGLHDRGADQHVEALLPEVEHHLLELVLAHLAVGRRDPRLGHELLDLVGGLLDRLHPVVDVEHLTVTEQLAAYGGGDLAVLVGADVGEHRVPLLRRRRDRRHLADAGDRHLQGARDRRRGHGEDVDAGAQRLHLLLVLDAEALLLIDDDQAEVLDLDVAVEQPVGADHDVDAAVGQPFDDLARLLVALEPAQRPQRHREAAHPLGEGRVVLGDEQRRRHQHRHLLALLHRLERGPDGDLGLAVADVAADQPVHGYDATHVGLDLLDRAQLVGGLVERERILELGLPRGVRPEGVPLGGLSGGVQLDQLGRDLAHRLARAALALGPVGAAEAVEAGRLATDVAGHLVERVGRHEEPVGRVAALGGAVLQDEVLAHRAVHLALPHLHEPADAVLLVHDEVAGLELERVDLLLAPRRHLAHVARGGLLAGDVLAGEDHQAGALEDEAVLEATLRDQDEPFGG